MIGREQGNAPRRENFIVRRHRLIVSKKAKDAPCIAKNTDAEFRAFKREWSHRKPTPRWFDLQFFPICRRRFLELKMKLSITNGLRYGKMQQFA
jgi:hypothetical protein